MVKSILASGPVQAVLGALLAGYMSLVKRTTRWEVRGLEHVRPIWEGGEGVVGCVWHGRILMTIAAWPKDVQPPSILISRSKDGAVVAQAARRHGAVVVRGSSRNRKKTKEKGGFSAFREMVRWVQRGGCMAITPDGPRGPRMRAGLGAVKLARAAGAPLLPLAWSTTNALVFESWDRFFLPLPFGRGVIVWGEAVRAPSEADQAALEAARARLEAVLIAANQEADRACGKAVIEPAEAFEAPSKAVKRPSEAAR